MSTTQFTALIRLPFSRGSFVDPPQVQWDAEKDRQLWKVISKSSKTSDLNWVELASKFQVPPTFLLQQAAWLYERHFEHVRSQMKKVSGSNVTAAASGGGSTLTPVGGVAMQRAGSGGAGHSRTTSALSGQRKNSPSLGLQEAIEPAPALTRTPSTTTITQFCAQAQQLPTRTLSARSAHRPKLARPTRDDRSISPGTATQTAPQEPPDSPEVPASSSSSSSSLSDTDHPAHRSQLFKRPPRFQQKRPRELAPFAEGDGTQEGDGAGSQGNTLLPFASTARRPLGTSRQHVPEQSSRLADRQRGNPTAKQSSPHSQMTTETASSMTSSASASDAPSGRRAATKSPVSPNFNHRAAMANLGSPRAQALRRKEGSEGTPSMGSSFSDIDDAGISQSALEEALLSNMQHGRMTPALTLHYTRGSNSIDTVAVAASIYSLSGPPGDIPSEPVTVEATPCSPSFLTTFWNAAASLLDYFADFYATDTPVMQSMWFHLFDTWQAAAASALPLYEQDHRLRFSYEAQEFKMDYKETLFLFQRLVQQPQKEPRNTRDHTDETHAEALLHAPKGRVETPTGAFETGLFLSGLKPWQQFLCAGAPGFTLAPPHKDSEAAPTNPDTRYIPQPGLALMQAHTHRARSLLTAYTTALDPSSLAQNLAAFDATALVFPSVTLREYTAQSRLYASSRLASENDNEKAGRGTLYTYALCQAAPPVRRHEGLSDPSMMVEPPTLLRLDEAVGNCKGTEAYVPMTGPRDREGVGFDVWAVQGNAGVGVGGGEGEGLVLEGCGGEVLFDEWEFGSEMG